jgi:Tfp pilus assembly protein PilF
MSLRPCLAFVWTLALALPAVAQSSPLAPSGVTPAGGAPAGASSGAAPSANAVPGNSMHAGLTTPGADADKKIADAIKFMNTGDADGALNALTQAIQLNPTASSAYVLRGSIYTQRHQWTNADADFTMAQKLAPKNSALKFQTVELKFMQKQYDAARSGFLVLESDPDMGDYAKYKVFLCDLWGGHEPMAKHELDVFNDVMGNASYFFSNAAWDLYHRDTEGARSWLNSASRVYEGVSTGKFILYAQPLRDMHYLPLPLPKDGSVDTSSAAAH